MGVDQADPFCLSAGDVIAWEHEFRALFVLPVLFFCSFDPAEAPVDAVTIGGPRDWHCDLRRARPEPGDQLTLR